MAARTPANAHSATIPGTVAAGVAITARSGRPGNLGDGWITCPPQRRRVAGIHRVYRTRKRGQVFEYGPADGVRSFRRADHRDGPGVEKRIERLPALGGG